MKRLNDILCMVETGDAYEPAQERAVSLTDHSQAKLTIFNIVERIVAGIKMPQRAPISADLQTAMANAQARGLETVDYIKPLTHLVNGWASQEIPALANQIEADPVVMGTVCRTGVHGFIMGNSAEIILNKIDCPVFTIKPPGFVMSVILEN